MYSRARYEERVTKLMNEVRAEKKVDRRTIRKYVKFCRNGHDLTLGVNIYEQKHRGKIFIRCSICRRERVNRLYAKKKGLGPDCTAMVVWNPKVNPIAAARMRRVRALQRDGVLPKPRRGPQQKKKTCGKGHFWTASNTRIRSDGQRSCIACGMVRNGRKRFKRLTNDQLEELRVKMIQAGIEMNRRPDVKSLRVEFKRLRREWFALKGQRDPDEEQVA